jgi:hypothetical protein
VITDCKEELMATKRKLTPSPKDGDSPIAEMQALINSAVDDRVDNRIDGKIKAVVKQFAPLLEAPKETKMSNTTPQDMQAGIAAAMAQITKAQAQPQGSDILAYLDKKFDDCLDPLVDRVMAAQAAGKSWYTSPIFVGGVAVAAVIAIGGTLYLFNKRLNTLEEIAAK